MIEITRSLRGALQKQLKEALTLAMQEKKTAENKEIMDKKVIQPLLKQIEIYEKNTSKLEKQLFKSQEDIRNSLKEFVAAVNTKNIKQALISLQVLHKTYEEQEGILRILSGLEKEKTT